MLLPRLGIVGASGLSGAVLTSLLARHRRAQLVFATSDKLAGQAVSETMGVDVGELRFCPNADGAARGQECDLVFLATSAEVSADLAPKLVEKGVRVVDLSGAFRLEGGDYPTWYRFEHPAPALLDRAHYGLPELVGAPPPDTLLVANPGCYATAAILALAPLLRAGLIEPTGIVVDAKSGVTGAGRQAKEEYSFSEVANDLRAYKLLSHQHTPEIARSLGGAAGEAVRLTFTAHLLPITRGILATCYARPRPGTSARDVAACLAEAYSLTPFVKAMAPERVRIASVAGTNLAHVGATASEDVVLVVSAIDNLLKGAAGQALQNANLMLGIDETTGLADLPRFAP